MFTLPTVQVELGLQLSGFFGLPRGMVEMNQPGARLLANGVYRIRVIRQLVVGANQHFLCAIKLSLLQEKNTQTFFSQRRLQMFLAKLRNPQIDGITQQLFRVDRLVSFDQILGQLRLQLVSAQSERACGGVQRDEIMLCQSFAKRSDCGPDVLLS